jgi:hypothetical protein
MPHSHKKKKITTPKAMGCLLVHRIVYDSRRSFAEFNERFLDNLGISLLGSLVTSGSARHEEFVWQLRNETLLECRSFLL